MSRNLNSFLLTNLSNKFKTYNNPNQNIILLPDSTDLNKSTQLFNSFIDVNKILDDDWEFIDNIELKIEIKTK
jgi:hypothetical protein